MESTRLASTEIKRSKSMNLPSKHTYYNIQDEIIQKNAKYGSFSSTRKHFQNKLSRSASNLYQTYSDIPFAQYSPDPYYGVLPNDYLSSSHIRFDPEHLYINSKDDISVTSKESDDEHDGVQIIETSSNSSFVTTDSHHSLMGKTATDILYQIIVDNRESSHHPLLGMALVTISAIAYATLNLSVKGLMHETPWQQLMFIRMTIAWVATMIWVIVQYKGKLSLCGPKHHRFLLTVRTIFLWGAVFSCWWSFEYLSVGDGTTLAMSFPLWVSIFAHFVWKNNRGSAYNSPQRLDLFGWICVLSGLLGITLVAHPSFIFGYSEEEYSSNRAMGVIIGCISAICAGAQYIIVNYTKKDTHWLQVEQMSAALSTFVLCPFVAIMCAFYNYPQNGNKFVIGWEPLSATRWVEEIAMGFLGFCALALLTRGAQLDAPARTAMCLYLEIPFVYLGQCIMTKVTPDIWVYLGIFLVLCSVIIPAVRKLRAAKRKKVLYEKLSRYSEHSDLDETVPLMRDDVDYTVNVGAVSGVTVEWSSEESDTDIDDENVVIL